MRPLDRRAVVPYNQTMEAKDLRMNGMYILLRPTGPPAGRVKRGGSVRCAHEPACRPQPGDCARMRMLFMNKP